MSGGSGLPMAGGHGTRGSSSSVASTVYGTVTQGPLAKSRTTDLRLPKLYPSAQEMGVSAHGRRVLEAAKNSEIQRESERLLRDALHDKKKRDEATAASRRGLSATVGQSGGGGGGSGSGGAVPPAGAARKREREAEQTEVDAAMRADRQRRLAAAPTALPSKVPVPVPSSSHPSASSTTEELLAQIRQQFAPLHRSGADVNFRAVASQGTGTVLSATAPVGTSGGGGMMFGASVRPGASVLVDTVKRAMRSNDPQMQQQLRQAAAKQARNALSGGGTTASAIGALADGLTTSNDGLIREAELNRVRDFLDHQSQKEAALRALEERFEQRVRALYCHTCREWHGRLPAACAEQHHRVERKETVRRFYACEHCGCKMSFVGEDTKPWRLMPRCPRCAREVTWEKSNAAPEVATASPFEDRD